MQRGIPKVAMALALVLAPAAVRADEVAKRESVERLLELTNSDAILETVYAQMGQFLQGMAQELGVRPSERELFDRHHERTMALLGEEMSWERMKGPMSDVYLKHFSEQELADMIAFYESETGRAMVEKMPAVMADSMAVSQSMVRELLPRLQELSAELERELAQRRESSE